MKVNKTCITLIIIFTIVVIICICVIYNSYEKNKPYNPDATVDSLISSNDLEKIRQAYEKSKMKEKFIETFKEVEQNISKKVLDGNVIDEDTLNKEIAKINEMLLTEDWSYIKSDFPKYWMGTWSINKDVKLSFKFAYKDIEPSWVSNEDVRDYIIKN